MILCYIVSFNDFNNDELGNRRHLVHPTDNNNNNNNNNNNGIYIALIHRCSERLKPPRREGVA